MSKKVKLAIAGAVALVAVAVGGFFAVGPGYDSGNGDSGYSNGGY